MLRYEGDLCVELPMANRSMREQSAENAINQEKNNPCLKEQKLSYQCLEDNGYDHDKCKLQFENFKTCKRFWLHVAKDRRRKGIQPDIPPPEERAAIKREYLKKRPQT